MAEGTAGEGRGGGRCLLYGHAGGGGGHGSLGALSPTRGRPVIHAAEPLCTELLLGLRPGVRHARGQRCNLPQAQTHTLRHRHEPDTISPQRTLSPEEKYQCRERDIQGCNLEHRSKDEDSEVAASP